MLNTCNVCICFPFITLWLWMLIAQWNLSTVLKLNGCGTSQCATQTHYLLPSDIMTFHNHFQHLSRVCRRKWLLDYFVAHSSRKDTTFLVSGKVVCQNLWIATLGISQTAFYSIRKLFLEGTVTFVSGSERSPLLRTTEALAWMENYFTLVGDSMPNQMALHLPSSLSKLSVYQRLHDDFKKRGKNEIVSQSQFFKLWESNFSNVVIPKVGSIIINLLNKFDVFSHNSGKSFHQV